MNMTTAKRSGVTLVIFIASFFGVWTAWVIVAWQLQLVPEPARLALRTAIWIAAAVIWVRWIGTRTPLTWLGVGPVTTAIVAASLAPLVILVVWAAAQTSLSGRSLDLAAHLNTLTMATALVGVFVEELVFRGVIQTELGEHMSPPFAITTTAILFVLIHVPGWYLLGIPATPQIIISVFAVGMICGALRHACQSLWPAVTAHWANNVNAAL